MFRGISVSGEIGAINNFLLDQLIHVLLLDLIVKEFKTRLEVVCRPEKDIAEVSLIFNAIVEVFPKLILLIF